MYIYIYIHICVYILMGLYNYKFSVIMFNCELEFLNSLKNKNVVNLSLWYDFLNYLKKFNFYLKN